ncbi:MAG: hypothetical protein DI586_05475, partial [Micavibrio aeruginosavorus]
IISESYKVLDDPYITQAQINFRSRLWSFLVPAELMAGHNDEAIRLLSKEIVFGNTYPDFRLRDKIINDTAEWFIHRGEYEWGRKVYAKDAHYKPSGFEARRYEVNRLILANTLEDFNISVSFLQHAVEEKELTSLFDLLPKEELLRLSQLSSKRGYHHETTDPADAFFLSLGKMAFTRSWLLGDEDMMVKSALGLENIDLSGDKSLLNALDGDDMDMTLFFLRHPRMRPYGVNFDLQQGWLSSTIDVYNHNDNNWWCNYKPDIAGLEDAWSFIKYNDYNINSAITVDKELFAKERRAAILAHPAVHLIDQGEINRLAEIPNAPEYLSKKVIAAAGLKHYFLKALLGEDKRIPEALHLSVRATRYGCNRDGKHGDYSYKSFKILHQSYKDSVWTAATPYWFN